MPIEKNERSFSITLKGKAPFGTAKELSDFLGRSLHLEYNYPTPPPRPGVIYASLEHIMLALSPLAVYAGKKAIDICADEVRKWLDSQNDKIEEVVIHGANGEVVKVVKREKTKEKG